MKFKKILSYSLSALLFVSSSAFNFSNANSLKDEYFDKLKSVSSWEKPVLDSKASITGDLSTKDISTSFGYDIEVSAKSENKKLKSFMEIKFIPKNEITPKIPDIKLYFDAKNFYLNKEAFEFLGNYIGITKKFEKDFVKIPLDKEDSKKIINSAFLENYSKNSAQITEKMIAFVKNIDLGVDLNFTKKDDNTYNITWDSDKIVDILDAYIRYVLSNFDNISKFYKEVLGIDLYATMPENTTKQDLENSLKDSLEMYEENISPILNEIKQIVKGSSINVSETFPSEYDKNYESNSKIKIVINIEKIKKLTNADAIESREEIIGGSNEPGTIVVPYGKDKTNNDTSSSNTQKEEKLQIIIDTNQVLKNDLSLNLNAPWKYEVFDYLKYMQEREKMWKEQLDKIQSEQQTKEDLEKYKLEFIISPSKKTMIMNEYGTITNHNIDSKIQDGTLYISKENMSLILNYELESDEQYLPFKETLTKHGYEVSWDSKTHTVKAIMLE